MTRFVGPQWGLLPWVLQVDLVEGFEMGLSLSQVSGSLPGCGSICCGFSPQRESQALQLSSSEVVDIMSVNTEGTVDLPSQSLMQEELVEVVTQ